MSHVIGLCTFLFKFWWENSKWSSCQQLVSHKHRNLPIKNMYIFLGSRSERGGARRAPTKRVFFYLTLEKCDSTTSRISPFHMMIKISSKNLTLPHGSQNSLLHINLLAFIRKNWPVCINLFLWKPRNFLLIQFDCEERCTVYWLFFKPIGNQGSKYSKRYS